MIHVTFKVSSMKENIDVTFLATGSRTHVVLNSSQRQVLIYVNITGKSKKSLPIQPAFTCSKLRKETLEQRWEICS